MALWILALLLESSAYIIDVCPIQYTCNLPSGADICDPTQNYTVLKCPDSMYLDIEANDCYSQQSRCKCLTREKCNQCLNSYLAIFMKCNTPPCTAKYCYEADKAAACILCAEGHFLNKSTNACDPCITECKNCTSATKCNTCFNGFYLDSENLCTKCSANCIACINETKCSECGDGYFLSMSFCVVCNIGCKLCVNEHICRTCFDGYYFQEESSSCEPCVSPCINCRSNADCLLCNSSYFLDSGICKSCGPSCAICNNSWTCLKCSCGNYLSLVTKLCKQCPPSCTICDSDTSCSICSNGYFLSSNTETTECISCKQNCIGCHSKEDCYLCKNGYYLNDNDCKKCELAYCQICLENKCLECDYGYYLLPNFGTCAQCESTCSNCIRYNICNTCVTGYTFLDGNCLNCGYGCDLCITEGDCLHCKFGYYIDGALCKMCFIAGCVHCENSTKCLKCKDGYYLNGNECNVCDYKCEKCISTNYCMTCNTGYYKGITDCFECLYKCKKCSNTLSCHVCDDGYYFDDIKCEKCMSNCVQCSSATKCTRCENGYSLNADENSGNCTKFNDHCLNLVQISSSQVNCTACEIGYFIQLNQSDNISSCIQCDEHCSFCFDETKCKFCSNGYYLTDDEDCLPCIFGCKDCVNNASCITCYSSQYINGLYNPGYECKICPFGCFECNYDSCFYKCSTNITIDLYQGEVCYDICGVEACLVCSDEQCKECIPGYFLNPSQKCRQCDPICKECDSDRLCTKCYKGFYLSYQGNCITCADSSCNICSDKYVCVECKPFYYLNTTTQSCDPCQLGCIRCTSLKTCLNCATFLDTYSFYLDVNSCVQCPVGCYNCSNALTCYQCRIGYFLTSLKSCHNCATGCMHCINEDKCYLCKLGFYMDEGVCYECPEDCLNCVSPIKCTKCQLGFSLTSNECELTCLEYCVECNEDEGVCAQCMTGYYLKNGACRECPSSKSNCTYNESTKEITGNCSSCYYFDIKTLDCNRITIENCAKLDKYSSCTDCETGYRLTYEGKCEAACVPNCLICSTPYTCDTCNQDYDNEDGEKCLLYCPPNCKLCDRHQLCTECNDGFNLIDDECVACIKDTWTEECKNFTNGGCNICKANYYYAQVDNSYHDCNIIYLDRAPIYYTYYLCTGEFTDTFQEKLIGKGYSGYGQNKFDLCSVSNPRYGVIPIGKYRISDILCEYNNTGNYRVLKLEAISKFSNWTIYESYYVDLYIYPESKFEITTDYSYAYGQNGIVLNKGIRDQLTIDDVIEVTTTKCSTDVIKCSIYPPPAIGTLEITDIGSNSFRFIATNWGVSGNSLTYSVCIYLTPYECSDLCESTTANFICNDNNKLKLGYYNSGGTYIIQMRVGYSDKSKKTMYSDIQIPHYIASIDTTATPSEAAKKNVSQFTDLNTLLDYYYLMRMAIRMLKGVANVQSTRATYNKSVACTRSYCSFGGACRVVDQMRICNCTENYTGFRCQLNIENYNIIQSVNQRIITDATVIALQDEETSNKILDAYLSITGLYTGLSDELCNSILKKVSESLLVAQTDSIYDKAIKIGGNIITTAFLQKLQPYVFSSATLTNGQNSTSIKLETLVNAIQILEKYVASKAKDLSFGSAENLYINGMLGSIFRKNANYNSANVSADFDGIIFSIELPYLMKDMFEVPDIYEIDSSILYVSSYTEGPDSSIIAKKYNLSFNLNMGDRGEKVYSRKCGCYNPSINKISTSHCKSMAMKDGTISCRCGEGPLMCFVMKQVAVSAGISIAVPVVGGSILVALAIILILLRKRICKNQHRYSPPRKEENDKSNITQK